MRATSASVRWPTTSRPRRIHDRRASSRRMPVDSATAVARPPRQARRFEDDEERLRPPGERRQPAEPVGDPGRACPGRPAGRRAGRGRAGPPSGRPAASHRWPGPRRAWPGVMTTSHSSRTPRATASTGSKLRDRSSQATIEPAAWASAASRRASVVRPLEPSPRIATLAELGRPPGPEDRVERGEAGVDDAVVRVEPGVVGRCRGLGRDRCGRRGECRAPSPAPGRAPPIRRPRSCRSPASLEARHGCRHVRGEGRHRTLKIEHLFDRIKSKRPTIDPVTRARSAPPLRLHRPVTTDI